MSINNLKKNWTDFLFTKEAIFFRLESYVRKGNHVCSVKNKDKFHNGAEITARNSVLSRQTASNMFFWFPVTGFVSPLIWALLVCVQCCFTHMCNRACDQRMLERRMISCCSMATISGSGPETVLVSLSSRDQAVNTPAQGKAQF